MTYGFHRQEWVGLYKRKQELTRSTLVKVSSLYTDMQFRSEDRNVKSLLSENKTFEIKPFISPKVHPGICIFQRFVLFLHSRRISSPNYFYNAHYLLQLVEKEVLFSMEVITTTSKLDTLDILKS